MLTRAKPVHSTAKLLPEQVNMCVSHVTPALTRRGERVRVRIVLLTEVNDGSLGAIVHGLELRNVDDATAHGGGGDEAASDVVLERLAIEGSSLLLLATEVSTSRFGTPHDTIHIDSHDLLGSLSGPINESTILPGDSRIGDKDIETAVELSNDAVDGGLYSLVGDDVDLVRLAYWAGT